MIFQQTPRQGQGTCDELTTLVWFWASHRGSEPDLRVPSLGKLQPQLNGKAFFCAVVLEKWFALSPHPAESSDIPQNRVRLLRDQHQTLASSFSEFIISTVFAHHARRKALRRLRRNADRL
jgi:hypothetical protein